ncbi:MAG: hypothetical protein Q4B57_00860 [Eubacteriales bacterium]|nr:hypothetical protein [Eubacteriales bacterium]
MKEYEVVWEIFNRCSNNQMRDIFIEELQISDIESYVQKKFAGKDVSYERSILENGTIVYDIMTSEIKQRLSFTEII